MKRTYITLLIGLLLILTSSCKDFLFGRETVTEENNPLIEKKVPRTGADTFIPPVVTEQNLKNPDADGALANWATCLVMFKEGHSHRGGKLHGNFVYARAPWRQEQFVVIHNKPNGIEVKVDTKSTITYIEEANGKQVPEFIRLVGGRDKLWGLCFYFFDKEGKLMNDAILQQSERYQLFFSISDVDHENKPYEVMDLRYRGDTIATPIPSPFFADKQDFESRRIVTPRVFKYTYRDTWTHDDMGDGVREYFNIKMFPPLKKGEDDKATAAKQDCVGLKGHLDFYPSEEEESIDLLDWPLKRSDGRGYNRMTTLLPQFYLAVKVMKCEKGKKAVEPVEGETGVFKCSPSYAPNAASGWKELFRMNIPVKVCTNMSDSDPTVSDYNEPYYYHLSRELGISPKEAYEATQSIQIHGNGNQGGVGFGAWFL